MRALITWPSGFDVFEMAAPFLRGPRLVVRWRRRLSVTTLRVDARALVITAGLWRRNRRLASPDVANVFVTSDDDERRYVLRARDWDGEVHELVTLETLEQARWLEARIELHLGLHHVAEPDEVARAPVETLEASSWSA